jgi:hypothetical protein
MEKEGKEKKKILFALPGVDTEIKTRSPRLKIRLP